MTHNAAMPHGSIQEIFPDVFFITGTMRNEFFGSMWQFGRNMVVVREKGELTLFNAVRLDEAGLKALEALGTVKNVVQLGSMHGHDDRFYVDHYDATFWSVEGMPQEEDLSVDRYMTIDGELPISGAKLFVFVETKLPEAIVVLERDGGIAIACDALQNWVGPDAFTDEETAVKMSGMGFFTPANLGVGWMHAMEPKAGDFLRLKELPFNHALPAHGVPLLNNATPEYHATFQRLMGV